MNTNMMIDIDPLSSYECQQYDNYPHINPHPYPPQPSNSLPSHPLPFPFKQDQYYPLVPPSYQGVIPPNTTLPANTSIKDTDIPNNMDNVGSTSNSDNNTNVTEEKDIKPDISQLKLKRSRKARGRQSSYWNKKITDKNFAFYGCSVCNVAYTDLQELDKHVVIHSNRMTSYDLRLQNLKKRKRLKKEKKKIKKSTKIKEEFTIEIKPEDGYIGTERAADCKSDIQGTDNLVPEVIENNCATLNSGTASNNISKNQDSSIKDGTEKCSGTEKGDSKISGLENNENTPLNADVKSTDKQNCVNVYKCFGCHKQFALSYYLKIHVRSHTDEKPYTCNVCGQNFITASKLGRHNKRVHLSVRHQCRICYKYFTKFDLLTVHFDKKHPEDKLEGEPYDYNAILPYLKELEEELKEEKEKKPKVESLWGDMWPLEEQAVEAKQEEVKQEAQDNTQTMEFVEDARSPSPVSVLVEEVKVDVEIKEEKEEPEDEEHHNDQSLSSETVKNERESSGSESEYFPSESWSRAPPPPPPPAAPPRPPPPACRVCHKQLSSKSYLRVHMRTHTGEKPFTCYICKRGFITASKMHRHVLTHDESWEGKDGIKPENSAVKSENDSDDEVLKPKKISKVDRAKAKLLKKNKKQTEKKPKKYRKRPHTCEFCHQRFLHIETLQVHKKSHAGEALVYRCSFCLEPQGDEEAFKAHEAAHTGPKPYLCTLCGNTYKKRETMVYHRKTHHSEVDGAPTRAEKCFVCDICSKRFGSQAKLQKHLTSHTTARYLVRYECPVCAHMFHTRYHVHMHLATHIKEGLILEENRAAVLAMVLQNARKIPKTPLDAQAQSQSVTEPVPNDERSRICNICGEIFQHFYYLEEHLKTHGSKIAIEDLDKEEEKKYTCQVCSKSFKLHYYLKLHSYTHTKEKPFICQQCGKGFITKGKLKRHLETHQGLKKYQCHICYKFFTRPSYLRIHVRTIHGTQDYNFRDYGLGVPIGAVSASGSDNGM